MATDLYIINLKEISLRWQNRKYLLAQDEIKRLETFATQELQKNFLLTHIVLRLILAKYVTQPPSKLAFTYNTYGKPSLAHSAWQFNISHSKDYLVIAVTEHDAIGVDIEYCHRVTDFLEIANRFFTPKEIAAIQNAADPLLLFFHIWTQKEAFLKAIGKGISFGLEQFEVSTHLHAAYVQNIRDPAYTNCAWESRCLTYISDYRIIITQENQLNALKIYTPEKLSYLYI